MDRDPAQAALSANAIVAAAEKAISKVVLPQDVTGFTAESSAASLMKSQVLQNFVADSKTRSAILQAASVAAQSGIFSVTDSEGKVSIDPDSITTFLEKTVGDKTGQAAIDAVNAYTRKTKDKIIEIDPSTGTAVTKTKAEIRQEQAEKTARENRTRLKPQMTMLKGMLPNLEASTSSYTPYYSLGAASTNTKKMAEALGVSAEALVEMSRLDLIAKIKDKIVKNTALSTAPSKPSTATTAKLPGMRPDANEIAFRKAMANMGKPKDENKIPSPTQQYYKDSLKKSDDFIKLLYDLRTNTQKTGGNYTYTFKGAIP